MRSPEVVSELNTEISQLHHEPTPEEMAIMNKLPERIRPGLMAMGEDDEQGTGEDEEFKGDDISSLAHGELEQHREIREMARIAAWEMPLLSSTLFLSSSLSYDCNASVEESTRKATFR